MSKLHLLVARARHEHDCEACELVGIQSGADLYFCPNNGGGYIVRRSSDGPDYTFTSTEIIKRFGARNELTAAAVERHKALTEMLAAR